MEDAIASSYLQRLSTFADIRLKQTTDIHAFEIKKTPKASWIHEHCTSHQQFKNILDVEHRQADLQTRIISLHCPLTILPLEVTKEDIIGLFERYQINSLFADAVMAFGSPPNPEDGGSAPGVVTDSKSWPQRNFECWYRLQYFERNNRSTIDPWSPRHTAVYQKYFRDEDFNLIVLLHSSDDSALEKKLLGLATATNQDDSLQFLSTDLRAIHILIGTTYLPNWQDHLRTHGEKLRSLTSDIDDIDLSQPSAPGDLPLMRELHHLRTVLSRCAIFCQGNSHILQKLNTLTFQKHNQTLTDAHDRDKLWLTSMAERLQDHATGYTLLKDQVTDSLTHLQYATTHQSQLLSISNQRLAASLNRTLVQSSYDTADDGRQIKVITILGLLYLPGSFVGTLFGMNFFDNGNWRMFLSIWLVLTAVTLGVWGGYVWQTKRVKRTRVRRDVEEVDGDVELGERC